MPKINTMKLFDLLKDKSIKMKEQEIFLKLSLKLIRFLKIFITG